MFPVKLSIIGNWSKCELRAVRTLRRMRRPANVEAWFSVEISEPFGPSTGLIPHELWGARRRRRVRSEGGKEVEGGI